MEQFGKCIKAMDESVKQVIDRSLIHCEKCQGCKLLYRSFLTALRNSTGDVRATSCFDQARTLIMYNKLCLINVVHLVLSKC